jgi:predicted dehydrogenase
MPPLARSADIAAIATATGVSARSSAMRFGAERATTDAEEVLTADDLDGVVIATRHDTHARYVAMALRSGKHVFVEKPLALSEEELREVESAAAGSDGTLMVGFNRRFAPQVVGIRDAVGGRGPLMISYRVNAGRLPRSHWTHDPEVGGGRIVGEGCHFVDVAAYLTGQAPTVAAAVAVSATSEPREDTVAATLSFPDGSVAQLVYSALGDPSLPKERLEVLGEAGAAVLEDFQELRLHRGGRVEVEHGKRDKGHHAELAAFLGACRTGGQVWPVADMAAVMRATFAIRDAIAPIASSA